MADADPKVLVDEIYQQAIGETADGAKVVPDRASAEKTFGKEAVEKAIALKEAETQKLSGERRTPAEDKISIYAYHTSGKPFILTEQVENPTHQKSTA